MKLTRCVFKFFLIVLCLSCKEVKEEPIQNPVKKNSGTSQEVEKELSPVDTDTLIQKLQGSWKEPEYPFNVMQFKGTQVKFIEEGVAEDPKFQEYRISLECPFDIDHIRNIGPGDILLILGEAETCEKLQISNDTLTRSGFSNYTGRDYHIIYKKEGGTKSS